MIPWNPLGLDRARRGFHRWNRLSSGVEPGLTREQFRRGQTVVAARVVERPPGPLPRRREEHLLPRERVAGRLGRLTAAVAHCAPGLPAYDHRVGTRPDRRSRRGVTGRTAVPGRRRCAVTGAGR
ncbi:YunG family protein [Streptomyces prasinus]|uniref:YunG family protein n=1 Tax=Streptomyces prasinus TaxID=67345 RepID=UPI000ABC134E